MQPHKIFASRRFNEYGTITQAVRSGMGIAELPAILLAEQRASLVRVLPKWTLGDDLSGSIRRQQMPSFTLVRIGWQPAHPI